MNSAEFQIQNHPVYRSDLGDAMWPGEGSFDVHFRNIFSEMLNEHLQKGLPVTGPELLRTLEGFIPASVRETIPSFYERSLASWNGQTRSQIAQRIQEFAIEGGWEARCQQQSQLLFDLENLGILTEGTASLRHHLAGSGDWHHSFLVLATLGRYEGLRLTCPASLDMDLVSMAMEKAGFSDYQIGKFIGNLPMPNTETSAPPAGSWTGKLTKWLQPKRITVGKMQDGGKAEAYLTNVSTGHPGTLTRE